MATSAETEILELEKQRCAAIIAADAAALHRLLHADMIYTHSSGLADTKSTFIEALASGKYAYKRIENTKESVRLYGDTALVSGQAAIDIDVEGAPRKLSLCYLAAWTRTETGWKFVAWQSAGIPT